jgi:RNA polymerase sigma factor (sigma-70 family)
MELIGPSDDPAPDSALLEQYASGRSREAQDAFALLVRRYLGLVYASAHRQVRDEHLADDVTQAVFIALAKKAASIPPGVVLSGWLLTATRYAASNARVIAARRRRHETRAAEMATTLLEREARDGHGNSSVHPELDDALDEALAELPAAYRDAVALRYFQDKTLAQVAAALRITEDAAKQRVSRAVRRLRAALLARGVAAPATALTAAISAGATEAVAPPALLDSTLAAASNAVFRAGPIHRIFRTRMNRRVVAVASALIAGAALVALAVYKLPAPATQPRAIVYTVDGMDKVLVDRDRSYKRIPQGGLWFDAYRPSTGPPATGWPVVVLIHGGPVPLASHPKDWPAFESYGRLLAASGVAAVTFNYRFPSSAALTDAAADVKDLIAHVRLNAEELGLDGGRIALWAFSGGGTQLAATLRDSPPYVRCVVSFYALLDAPAGADRLYSPLAQVRDGRKPLPPMLIAQAGRDEPYISRSVEAFLEESRRRGMPVEVVDYPQGAHAFDIEQDTDESRAVIARGVQFVKQHLLAKPDAKERQ